MNTVKINNEIGLTYPESFGEMNEEMLTKYFGSTNNRWGAYDADKHVILSVSWQKAGFLSFITDAESVTDGAEARLRRSLLNYQRVTSFKMKVAGKKAYGIRFEYRVNERKLVQVADLITFKHKKNFYSIYYVTRKINAGAERLVFQEIINSVTAG